MKIITLTHPILGLIAEKEFSYSEVNKQVIENRWKFKYGKKYNECKVSIMDGKGITRARRKVVNVATKEVYGSMKEASKKMGLAINLIKNHCHQRKLVYKIVGKFKVKFQ